MRIFTANAIPSTTNPAQSQTPSGSGEPVTSENLFHNQAGVTGTFSSTPQLRVRPMVGR